MSGRLPHHWILRLWETTNPNQRLSDPPSLSRLRTSSERIASSWPHSRCLQIINIHRRTLKGVDKKPTPIEEAMRNITVTIPDDAYRRARIWAAEHDTSLSAVVKYLLETMPGIKRSNLAFPARNSNPVNTSAPSPTPPAQ
jgi:hypothetical protein